MRRSSREKRNFDLPVALAVISEALEKALLFHDSRRRKLWSRARNTSNADDMMDGYSLIQHDRATSIVRNLLKEVSEAGAATRIKVSGRKS